MLMALMVGYELKPGFILDEVHSGAKPGWFDTFYKVCVMFVVPVVMAFVLAGQMQGFFTAVNPNVLYGIAFGLLAIFWIFVLVGKKDAKVEQ